MTRQPIDILHIASGDIWAGAEAQVTMLAMEQRERSHRVRVATFCEGELYERLRAAGVETRAIDERMGSARVWLTLRRWMSRDRPTLVHAHGYKEAILGLSATCGLGIARVRTLHGVPEFPVGAGRTMMRIYDAADHLSGEHLSQPFRGASARCTLPTSRGSVGRAKGQGRRSRPAGRPSDWARVRRGACRSQGSSAW